MKFIKSASALLLAALLLASCADTAGNETPAGDTAADTEAVTESRWADALPAGTDLGGKTITIHVRGNENSMLEVDTAEENGDVLNDTIYQRNRSLEERLNFTWQTYEGAGWADYGQEVVKIRASIAAGDNAWQIISGWGTSITPLALEHCFYDLTSMPYIDTTAPWWNQAAVNGLTLGGGLFFLTGDVSVLTTLGGAYVMFINDTLCTDNDIESIPALVRDGAWTMDKMTEIAKKIIVDLDGSGKMDDKDRYGLVLDLYNSSDSFYTSADIHQITITDGMPSYTPNQERLVKLMSYLEPFQTAGSSVGAYRTTDTSVQYNMFMNRQALMIVRELDFARTDFRELEDSYTIVPMPKLDDTQKNYSVAAYNGASLWGIPADNPDTASALIVMEAMAAESYKNVTPTYFNTCLQEKYARNEETLEMLDLIRNSLYLDAEYLYKSSVGKTYYMVRDMVSTKKYDVASHMAKQEKSILAEIEKTVALLESLND
ncbi:MAG: extracellular solute-binding protein [Clostridia bacterium]|nr:extracellular solute-binding protein [Clostridia bacterium]